MHGHGKGKKETEDTFPSKPYFCLGRGAVDQFVEDANSALLILFPRHPKGFLVLHDVGQDGTTYEDHVLATRRIFNPDFEFLILKNRYKIKKLKKTLYN